MLSIQIPEKGHPKRSGTNENILLARNILKWLLSQNMRDWVLIPGGRNAPFVYTIQELLSESQVNMYTFFDERSASFFALGRSASLEGKPVVIFTTSGTAVAELLPALIEAKYSRLPLVLVTADRPAGCRGTGAPQSIEQVGIFGSYVEKCVEIRSHRELKRESPEWIPNNSVQGENGDPTDAVDPLKNLSWSRSSSLHLNVEFYEPLLPENPNHRPRYQCGVQGRVQELKRDLREGLVIVGPLLRDRERRNWEGLLKEWGLPIYAEALSGLRGSPFLNHLEITQEKTVSEICSRGWVQKIIRLGGVPTLRFWRDLDLEGLHRDLPVKIFSSTPFPGLARKEGVEMVVLNEDEGALETDRGDKKLNPDCESPSFLPQILDLDQKRVSHLELALENHPWSEPSCLRHLINQMKPDSWVYIGNSLPIRLWDLVNHGRKSFRRLWGNRGANGIDGQISSFLGWATSCSLHPSQGKNSRSNQGAHSESPSDNESPPEIWAIVGDLTALYDLNALWTTSGTNGQSRGFPNGSLLTIAIINNGGGKIFDRIFSHHKEVARVLVNSHNYNFLSWAQMFGWDYQLWGGSEDLDQDSGPDPSPSLSPSPHPDQGRFRILEIRPDSLQTMKFWENWANWDHHEPK